MVGIAFICCKSEIFIKVPMKPLESCKAQMANNVSLGIASRCVLALAMA